MLVFAIPMFALKKHLVLNADTFDSISCMFDLNYAEIITSNIILRILAMNKKKIGLDNFADESFYEVLFEMYPGKVNQIITTIAYNAYEPKASKFDVLIELHEFCHNIFVPYFYGADSDGDVFARIIKRHYHKYSSRIMLVKMCFDIVDRYDLFGVSVIKWFIKRLVDTIVSIDDLKWFGVRLPSSAVAYITNHFSGIDMKGVVVYHGRTEEEFIKNIDRENFNSLTVVKETICNIFFDCLSKDIDPVDSLVRFINTHQHLLRTFSGRIFFGYLPREIVRRLQLKCNGNIVEMLEM